MTLTHLDLDRIEGFARVATPGPWAVHPRLARVDAFDITDPDGGTPLCLMLWPTDLRTEEVTDANAAFIAALDPTTVLAMITRMRELEGALDLALSFLVEHEPPDSRAVSSEFVAMAAIAEGGDLVTPECLEIIRTALQRKTS